MLNITLDIPSFLDGTPLSKEQGNEYAKVLVGQMSQSIYGKLFTMANDRLGKTRDAYLEALQRPFFSEDGLEGFIALRGNALALMVEDGAPAFDMKCIVNGESKVYTSKGSKAIKDVLIGDKVLTHKGKFQNVLKTYKELNDDEFYYRVSYKMGRNNYSVNVTKHHPILTDSGWVRACELNTTVHKVIVSAKKCEECGELTRREFTYDSPVFCNKSCAAAYHNKSKKGQKRQDLSSKSRKNISIAATKTNKNAYEKGTHVSQTHGAGYVVSFILPRDRVTNLKKAHSTLGKIARSGSKGEKKVWELLSSIDGWEKQHKFIRSECEHLKHRPRYFCFDFANPELKIAVEINGERFHTDEQNNERKRVVESYGWTYISFSHKYAHTSPNLIADELVRVSKNHSGDYFFINSLFDVEKVVIKKSNHSTRYKYNLEVDVDNSFMVNHLVVHNSGFANSPKRKEKKGGGWYMTIPFRWATPKANASSSAFAGKMPESIYNQVKKKSASIGGVDEEGNRVKIWGGYSTKGDIANAFGAYTLGTRKAFSSRETGISYDEYQHKSNIYEGIYRVRKTYNSTQSQYVSFRRVSDESPAASWIHSGIDARKFFNEVVDSMEFEEVMENTLLSFLNA